MSIYFEKAGLQTSIQDAGRKGLMHLGISNSGAMDNHSLRLANWLVDKSMDSPLLEITLVGPTICFEATMTIAVCGATFDLHLNGAPVPNNETINISKGDVLVFGQLRGGARAYLAFAGNITMEPTLKSYSTHLTTLFGGFKDRQINSGDRLEVLSNAITPYKKLPKEFDVFYSGNYLLRCVSTVESALFSLHQSTQFYSLKYTVTNECNRMGLRLSGEAIHFDNKIEITSSGLSQGSIQIPPSGQPIISSVDGQTIGGYPRIANIISVDLPLLGQLKPGDRLGFAFVSQSFAEQQLMAIHNRYEGIGMNAS